MTTDDDGVGRPTKQKRTERRQLGERERMRENCTGQGTRVNLGGGKRGVPEPSFDGKSSKLNVQGKIIVTF